MNQKKQSNRNVTILVVGVLIISGLICLAHVFCLLCVCCPELMNEIIPECAPCASMIHKERKIEINLISTGLSIIGLAVTVWTGLNIINVLERKEFELIKNDVEATKNAIGNISNKIKKADQIKLLNEMYYTVEDAATKELIKIIQAIPDADIAQIDFVTLLEIERRFNNVYRIRNSDGKHSDLLLHEVSQGEELIYSQLNTVNHTTITLYLKYRLAEFHFYSGYYYSGQDGCETFGKAADLYFETAPGFHAYVPKYTNIPVDDIDFTFPHSKDEQKISAYFCNSIGEAYSKITEYMKKMDNYNSDNENAFKAIFYCAYATKWEKSEVYLRNYGCAIERKEDVSEQNYSRLKEIYDDAFGTKCTKNSLKTLMSVMDKRFNANLKIEIINIDKGEKRHPPLNNLFYKDNWNQLDETRQKQLIEMLQELNIKAKLTQKVYPSALHGYIYSCIYNRDMYLISNQDAPESRVYLENAQLELEVLEMLDRDDPVVRLLKMDMDALNSRLDNKHGQEG
ncbi:MAG: hypothetical protein J6L76_08625 [Clostridia bacterium]|nr:hypothetical protein [Clostridia bacterium]